MYERECDSESEYKSWEQSMKLVYIRFMILKYMKNILLNKMSYTIGCSLGKPKYKKYVFNFQYNEEKQLTNIY